MQDRTGEHDRTLVSSAASGDSAAFEVLVHRHYNMVFAVALAQLREAERADELAQEVFVRAYMGLPSLKLSAYFPGWLCTITRNLATDWARRAQTASRLINMIPLDDLPDNLMDSRVHSARERMEAQQNGVLLQEAISRLPLEEREVVLLHYMDGLTKSEIARRLEVHPSSVGRYLDRALLALRRTLGQSFPEIAPQLQKMPHGAKHAAVLIGAIAAMPAPAKASLAAAASLAGIAVSTTTAAGAKAGLGILGGIVKWKAAAAAASAFLVIGGTAVLFLYESENATPVTRPAKAADVSEVAGIQGNGTRPGATPRRATIRTVAAGSAASATSKAASVRPAPSAAVAAPPKEPVGTATVRGRVIEAGTSVPLHGVLVRALSPAEDMRGVRGTNRPTHLAETSTDADGRYELAVPLMSTSDTLSVDALHPGHMSLLGAMSGSGDFSFTEIAVSSGSLVKADLVLTPAPYVQGTVVDHKGQAIAKARMYASLATNEASYWITTIQTGPDGKFEIFDFPDTPKLDQLRKGTEAEGTLTVDRDDLQTTWTENIYRMSPEERTKLRIVMNSGLVLDGVLLSAEGAPVSGENVSIEYIGKSERRQVKTDQSGRFRLAGLPSGTAKLYAFSTKLEQKVSETMEVNASNMAMRLQLLPTEQADTSSAVTLLGMKLIDVTPQLQRKYDLYHATGVMVLDPGPDHTRLGIGELSEGDVFLMGGMKTISTLHEFAQEVVRLNQLSSSTSGEGYQGHVRVVYTFSPSRGSGTNTQYMKVTEQDAVELRQFLQKR